MKYLMKYLDASRHGMMKEIIDSEGDVEYTLRQSCNHLPDKQTAFISLKVKASQQFFRSFKPLSAGHCPAADAFSVLSLDSIPAPFRKHHPKYWLLSSS